MVQAEHDDLLRQLNLHQIEDKATRDLLVKTRDAGYDYFHDNHPELNNPTNEDDIDKYLKNVAKYVTLGLMRAGRYV